MNTTLNTSTTLTTSDIISRDSRVYSLYVARNRAIPSIEDGLKFGQRIALHLLSNRAEKIKTYALTGLAGYAHLYNHGENSMNDAIGLLAAPFCNNVPLIEGLGQFGSRIKPGTEGIGSPRYTEVKRTKAAQAILYADLDIVPQQENLDGTSLQPKHFLPLIPTVLLNGISGMAVGWSTEILPRSLKSLIKATQDALEGRPVTGLEPHFEKFDVTIKNIGTNQWEFSGKLEIVDASTIRIIELPPGMKIESFRERLIDFEDKDLITGFTDRSTKKIDITVKFKRGSIGIQPASVEMVNETVRGKVVTKKVKIPAISAWTVEQAIKFFKLHERVTERIVVLDWGGNNIKQYSSPEEVVQAFVKWRLTWYTVRYQNFLDNALYEKNFWLILAALFKDKFPNRLGPNNFSDKKSVETEVVRIANLHKLVADDKQLDRVMNLPTYRWTKDFEKEVNEKIKALDADIIEYKAILASPSRIKGFYNDELEGLKKLKLP